MARIVLIEDRVNQGAAVFYKDLQTPNKFGKLLLLLWFLSQLKLNGNEHQSLVLLWLRFCYKFEINALIGRNIAQFIRSAKVSKTNTFAYFMMYILFRRRQKSLTPNEMKICLPCVFFFEKLVNNSMRV